jgi:hypothetical protein
MKHFDAVALVVGRIPATRVWGSEIRLRSERVFTVNGRKLPLGVDHDRGEGFISRTPCMSTAAFIPGGKSVARRPYKIARQEHLADALDHLQEMGRLRWRWDYDDTARRAIFHIAMPPDSELSAHDTRSAETIAQGLFDELQVRWRPVPHPGGEDQRAEVQRWITEHT